MPTDPGFRSWVMSRVRSRGTKPEMLVRRLLHGLGYRYRLHVRELPGSPDLVFPGRKKVIWVHGCFWHAHGCKNGLRVPKSNVAFWVEKKRSNVVRDLRAKSGLEALGWKCFILWECELLDHDTVIAKLVGFLS